MLSASTRTQVYVSLFVHVHTYQHVNTQRGTRAHTALGSANRTIPTSSPVGSHVWEAKLSADCLLGVFYNLSWARWSLPPALTPLMRACSVASPGRLCRGAPKQPGWSPQGHIAPCFLHKHCSVQDQRGHLTRPRLPWSPELCVSCQIIFTSCLICSLSSVPSR